MKLNTSWLVFAAMVLMGLAACSQRDPVAPVTLQSVPSGAAKGLEAEPLSPEQAFPLKVTALDSKTLLADFTPAADHYLYKTRISFVLKDASGVRLEPVLMPAGTPKQDPNFGEQEVYHQPLQIVLPLARTAGRPAKFTLVATYQGCNEKIGLCYSPIETPFDFTLP